MQNFNSKLNSMLIFDVKRVSWSLHVSQSRVRVAWRKESNSFTLRKKKGAQKAPTVTDDQFLIEERHNLNIGHNFLAQFLEGTV